MIRRNRIPGEAARYPLTGWAGCPTAGAGDTFTGVITFDDFDAWGETVSGASLSMVCDSVETFSWTLGIFELGGVVLQMAAEGGGNLCYGANTHAGTTLFVPLTHAHGHVVNGIGLDDDSLFAIPPGADFSIRVRRRAHAWCSIALPVDDAIAARTPATSARLSCPTGTVRALRDRVTAIAAAVGAQPAGSAAHSRAGADLLDAVRACLPGSLHAHTPAGRPPLDRRAIIRRSMAAIAAAPNLPTAADLAGHVGVSGRTLLRVFQETYGVAPKQYLLLRELHRIRQILAAGCPDDTTVGDVLVRNGIWEFGRFAGRYRARFGELPSETLRRARD